MSGQASRKGAVTRLAHGALLGAFGVLLFLVTRAVPDAEGGLWTIAAIGFLLLAGTLTSELLEPIGLPHLTGYLLAGIASGPHMLKLIDEHSVKNLAPVNTLALSLIALAGGAELDFQTMRRNVRSLGAATLSQCLLVLFVMMGVFYACRPIVPFMRPIPPSPRSAWHCSGAPSPSPAARRPPWASSPRPAPRDRWRRSLWHS